MTHTFFLFCSELTVTLEDMANQLLLPILGDANPFDIWFSTSEKAIEAKLRKGLGGGNVKLSNWIGAFTNFTAICCAAFIMLLVV